MDASSQREWQWLSLIAPQPTTLRPPLHFNSSYFLFYFQLHFFHVNIIILNWKSTSLEFFYELRSEWNFYEKITFERTIFFYLIHKKLFS